MSGVVEQTGRRRASLGPALAGLVDVGSSSVGNLAVNLFAAAGLGLAGYGHFSAGMLLGLLAVGFSRAVHSEPLVLRHAAGPADARDRAAALSLGSVLLLSTAVALAGSAVLLGLRPGSEIVRVLLVVAVVSPALLLQDAYRWAAHTAGRPAVAALNNTAWTVCLVAALVLVRLLGMTPAAPALVALWGGTALVGAGCAAWALGVRPAGRSGHRWLREQAGLSSRLLADWALLQATAEGTMLLVGVCAGSEALGLLRKAQLPLTPVIVLTSAMIVFLQPRLVRAYQEHGHAGATRAATRVGTVVVGGSAAYAAVVLLLPVSALSGPLGAGWGEARSLGWLVALSLLAGAVAAAAGIGLRAVGLLGRQVRARLVLSPLALGAVAIGALTGGALGAALALALASLVVAGSWCLMLAGSGPVRPGSVA